MSAAGRLRDGWWRAALVGVLCATTLPVSAADFGAAWTGDFASVLRGGLQQGSRHLGLVELTFDHEFLVAGRPHPLHVAAQHSYGGGFSEFYVGDLQAVSNIDAEDGTRVLEAWIEVPVSSRASVLVGRYDFNGEFDVIDAGGLFLSSSQGIGPDISQTGAAGPSIFPRTAFGVRVQWDGDAGLLRGAALDVESSAAGEYGDTPFAGGPMLALEYERPVFDSRLTLGAWHFTRSRPALADPDQRGSEYGAYASLEHEFTPNLSAYVRLGLANAEVSRIGFYAGGGIVHTGGLLPGRDDALGFAVGYARNGSGYDAAMQAADTAVTAAEQAYELTWRIALAEHLVLQPDLQYIVDPDTNPGRRDALVAILRIELAF